MQRAYHVMACSGTGIVGFLLLILVDSVAVRYVGLALGLCGIVTCSAVLLAWSNNNSQGSTQTAITSALMIMISNVGGLIGGLLYWASDAPRYKVSNGINVGFLLVTMLGSGLLRLVYNSKNKKLVEENNLFSSDNRIDKVTTDKLDGKKNKKKGVKYVL